MRQRLRCQFQSLVLQFKGCLLKPMLGMPQRLHMSAARRKCTAGGLPHQRQQPRMQRRHPGTGFGRHRQRIFGKLQMRGQQIHLVVQPQHVRYANQRRFDRLSPRLWIACIDHHQRQIGTRKLVLCTPDTLGFDGITGGAQTRGIHQCQRHTIDLNGFLQQVAGGSWDVSHNRTIAAGQSIEDRAFARVRWPHQHHMQTIPQGLTIAGGSQ